MKEITSNISNLLYSAKGFAILLVVAAHMTFSEVYPIAEIVRSSLGQIGVIIFFFISGFFYSRKKGDNKAYWYKKGKNLFVPWIIFSVVTFALPIIMFGQEHNLVFDFLKHFFGVGTWFWYMTVLVAMQIIFKYLSTSEWAIYRGVQIDAYINITSIPIELFGFVLVINLSNILSKSKIMCDIGKKSFFIYLMHIQVVGLINTRLPYNWFFFILRPFIGLIVCYIIACGVKFVLSKIKLGKYNFVFGLDR